MTSMTKLPRTLGVTSDIGVEWEVAKITPSAAAAMLETNTLNRPMRKTTLVAKYTSDMKRGKWKLTMDPIRFATDGTLLDGQHRLQACVEADKPFTSLVIYGLPTDVRDSIDMGKSRALSDVLAMNGHVNTKHLVAAARWIVTVKNGSTRNDSGKVSNSELMDIIAKHPRLPIVGVIQQRVVRRVPSPSLFSLICYLGREYLDAADRVDAFVHVAEKGVPDYDNDPVHMMREFVLKTVGSRSRLHSKEYFKVTVHVWNLFREKKPMKAFRWPSDVTIDGLDVSKL